jgi:hypothetical protein
LSRRENEAYNGTESECELCVKLQKSPSEKLDLLQFMVNPQAKEATDVKIQDQNKVDLLFQHQGYHPL